jgi:hypothetical protein
MARFSEQSLEIPRRCICHPAAYRRDRRLMASAQRPAAKGWLRGAVFRIDDRHFLRYSIGRLPDRGMQAHRRRMPLQVLQRSSGTAQHCERGRSSGVRTPKPTAEGGDALVGR